jgi:signal transduction histidine kinase
LQGKVETSLFRIAQEALINVAKHARATAVTVTLTRTTSCIELQIGDDGLGVPPERLPQPTAGNGWGLAIMAERARTIGAELQIKPGSDKGTTVVVTVPNGYWETA